MRHVKRLLAVSFAVLLFTVGLTYESSAQRRGPGAVRRPTVARPYGTYRSYRPYTRPYRSYRSYAPYRGYRSYPYVRRYPYWGTGYWGLGYSYWPYYYGSFYEPYYGSYYSYEDYLYHLEEELADDREELAEHEQKYRADGLITEKEQRQLDEDYRDVQKSLDRLERYRRRYP